MESQKLDSGIFIRLHSETIEALKKRAKKERRKLAEFLRLKLEDVANGDN